MKTGLKKCNRENETECGKKGKDFGFAESTENLKEKAGWSAEHSMDVSERAINRLLPQAEVIYLHYSADNMEEYDSRLDLKQPIISVIDRLTEKIQNTNKIVNVQVGLFRLEVEDFSEKVFQEALLNALSHRDYLNMGAVYVKHYPDRIVIENPGAFPEGVNEKNIITQPSTPRNKLIAETLQRLKYVQRTGQGVYIIFHI